MAPPFSPRQMRRPYRKTGNVSTNRNIHRLPAVLDTSAEEREALLVQKMQTCCVMFDFCDTLGELRLKGVKGVELRDLGAYVSNPPADDAKLVFTEHVHEKAFLMFSGNVFRTLPPSFHSNIAYWDHDEDIPTLEPAWPHMELVYEFFLSFLESPAFEADMAEKYLDRTFVLSLLDLFNSEDNRERFFLKRILIRVYKRFPGQRIYIMAQMNHIFCWFICESEHHNGMSELLGVLESMIDDFSVPLREGHLTLLTRILMPLHKAKSLKTYHLPLISCVFQFIERDNNLIEDVVKGLLKVWPWNSISMGLLFLNELEELLALMDSSHFFRLQEPIFKQLAQCVSSDSLQVTERALQYWNNTRMMSCISVPTVLPIVFPVLVTTIRTPWHQVNDLVYNALKTFMEISPRDFHLYYTYQHLAHLDREQPEGKEDVWTRIEEMARQNQ